mmetsp:Transcript_57885/g.102703  ORF Transcript_57885/g.102703 Transcript_57885/m.102703 type:complete len:103 (+) Transcript_57885:68-376(+)
MQLAAQESQPTRSSSESLRVRPLGFAPAPLGACDVAGGVGLLTEFPSFRPGALSTSAAPSGSSAEVNGGLLAAVCLPKGSAAELWLAFAVVAVEVLLPASAG